MDEREQLRKVRHRLAMLRHAEEVSGNVAATCRYYGISRQCFYKWKRRYDELGEAGLRDASSAPLRSPNQTKAEVVGKIIYLRSSYHFGPQKIAMYLRRYHDIEISPSGVWRILKRLDMNRLPASQRYKRHKDRWKRYEKALPGHRVQVDVKFIEPIAGLRGCRRPTTRRLTTVETTTMTGLERCLPVCPDQVKQRLGGPYPGTGIVVLPARVAQTAEQRTRNA